MSPIRILVLAVLFYIGYRLIAGNGKKKTVYKPQQHANTGETAISDTLEEDPVCKKLVPRQQAVPLQLNDKIYYFCSQECCDTFKTEQGEEQ